MLTRRSHGINAIHDASTCLVEALGRRGCHAKLFDWLPGTVGSAASTPMSLVVPYNPFFYGRWGFAPTLVRDAICVRLRSQRPLIALVVHEPYIPITGWRWLLMGAWQRIQLLAPCFYSPMSGSLRSSRGLGSSATFDP